MDHHDTTQTVSSCPLATCQRRQPHHRTSGSEVKIGWIHQAFIYLASVNCLRSYAFAQNHFICIAISLHYSSNEVIEIVRIISFMRSE